LICIVGDWVLVAVDAGVRHFVCHKKELNAIQYSKRVYNMLLFDYLEWMKWKN
jgi:hypothetical protein